MERNTSFRSEPRDRRRPMTDHDRHHDPTVHPRHPPGRPRRPARSTRPGALARRAPRRRRRRHQAVVRPVALRPLAERVRLAGDRGPDQRPSAVHDRDRRPERPLPPRPLARAERPAADRDPRLARLDPRVLRHHRAAQRPAGPRRRPGRRVRPRHPVDARLRPLGPDPRARLEPTTGSPRRGSS